MSAEPDDAAVVIPSTSPWASSTAPPESPETTSALSSIRPVRVSPALTPSLRVVTGWSSAVTVPPAASRSPPPSAFPTAVTASPTLTVSWSIGAVASPEAPWSRSTATSAVASVPTTFAA